MNGTEIVLIIAGILLVVFAFKFLANIAHHKMFRRGWAIFLWRFFSGAHWDGNPQTDSGWLRPGTKALTRTGYAPRYYFWPRWKRVLLRCVPFFGIPTTIGGLILDVDLTVGSLTIAFLGALGWLTYKTVKRLGGRAIARDWLQPLHQRVAPLAGIPLSASPRSWLSLTKDRSVARFALPPGFNDTEKQRERLQLQAAEALGMNQPDVLWGLEGGHQFLQLTSLGAAPDRIGLGDVLAAVRETLSDVFVLGLGRGSDPIEISLHSDSPHIGASMGAGAGKSTLAKFIAAQALYKGHIVIILDIKRISHTWAREFAGKNLIYADTPQLIHEALMWLGKELDRRNEVALIADASRIEKGIEDEIINSSVGDRIVIIAEEMNLTVGRLRAYWKDELGMRGFSPAITALQDVSFAGRQVLMNIFFIGQMLTARAVAGSGEARENVGVRMLARYTERNWKMQVPEHPMPIVSAILGRIQVIASGMVRECQVPYLKDKEAINLAKAGTQATLPPDVPKLLLNPYGSIKHLRAHPDFKADSKLPEDSDMQTPELEFVTGEIEDVSGDVSANVSGMPALSLSEIIDQNIFPGLTLAAIRKARQRDKMFPQPLPEPVGLSHVYDLGQVAEWYQMKYPKRGK